MDSGYEFLQSNEPGHVANEPDPCDCSWRLYIIIWKQENDDTAFHLQV